ELRPRNQRQFLRREVIVAGRVGIRVVHPGPADPDEGFARAGHRLGQIDRLHPFRAAEFGYLDPFHPSILAWTPGSDTIRSVLGSPFRTVPRVTASRAGINS